MKYARLPARPAATARASRALAARTRWDGRGRRRQTWAISQAAAADVSRVVASLAFSVLPDPALGCSPFGERNLVRLPWIRYLGPSRSPFLALKELAVINRATAVATAECNESAIHERSGIEQSV